MATSEFNALFSYLKPARNSGSNTPPPFIDDLFDVSDRSVMSMVVQKKRLREPHTSDDKGARARQAFRRASFEVTGLQETLEEQLDGFASIGIEVPLPRVRIRRQLLGGEQPATMLGIEGHEGGPAKGRVAQQQFGNGELLCRQGLRQHRTFSHRVGTPAGKEGHGGRKDQALQDQAIPLDPAPVATLGPRRLPVHIAQPGGNPFLVPVALMPERALGLVHAPINGRRLGLIGPRLDFGQDLVAQGLDLGFGFGQRGVQPPLQGPSMRDAAKTQRLPQGGVLGQKSMQFHSFKRPQHYPHYCQQQEGQAGEGTRTAPLALGRRFHIVFFNLLHYLEQCVGGDGVEVGSHKPQSLQIVLALCYPRPIYAQASHNTRLSVIARNALKPRWGEETTSAIEKQVEAGKLTLAELDALA